MRRRNVMKTAWVSLLLLLITCSLGWADDSGLVVQYAFDEGAGTQAKDGSGKGNDGNIQGAKFVKSPKGHALKFDGVDDFVECGASKSLQQLELAATIELWFKPEAFQGGLANWSTGSGSEDQRFVVAFKTVEGKAAEFIHVASNGPAYGKHSLEYGLDTPIKNAWNHLVLTFDSATITYYLDGRVRRVHSPVRVRPDLADIPLWIGRCQGLGKEFFKGLADEVRVYNRAISSDEILAHYKEGAAAFGKDTSVFERPEIRVEVMPEPGWIAVEADYGLMRPLPEGSSVEVQLVDQEAKTLAKKVARIPPQATTLNVVLNAIPLQRGNYLTRTTIIAADGSPIGKPAGQPLFWFGQSEKFKGIKILNNMVWELLRVEGVPVDGTREYTFKAPRPRWVYVMTAADASAGSLDISLDGYEQFISFAKGEKTEKESMRFLPAGEHKLILRSEGACRIETLVVRSIPEILSHEYIGEPFIKLDMSPWDFIEKYVMRNVNTFIVAPSDLDHPFFQKWQANGGRWRWLTAVTARNEKDGNTLTVAQVYEYLSTTAGFLSPLVEGMIVDEFGGSEPVLPNYGDALRKLRMTPEFKDKFMYVYCYGLLGLPGGTGQRLLDALAMTGSAMAWERYLKTQSNESAARDYLREALVQRAHEYRAGPSYMQYMAVCIGYFTKAGGHLLNATPSVNYKTYLDMQFNIVANDPVFWGTYGLMGYHSNYSDEETLRWMCKLFRHYGIEGNSEPATDDPYQPGHIQNSDFINGTDGWTLNPADEGSIRPGFRRGWGSLQTRYGSIEGDTFLVTVRNAKRANAFSQEIKNLQPGRLYSFRMYTADHADMSKEEKNAIRIQIENATLLPERSVTYVHSNPGHGCFAPYDKEGSAWMNYHWRVFRANGHSARLVISDWIGDDKPGGPVGQELMYNFISVQPYFSE